MSAFFQKVRSRAGAAFTALVLIVGGALAPTAAPAEQPVARPSFSIQAFCADPKANIGTLQAALRSRIDVPTTDRRYDEIVSGVMYRLFRDCLKGRAEQGFNVNLSLYVRNSRIQAYRYDRRLEFQEEVEELAPVDSDITAEDIFDTIEKKATTRQRMVFTMLVQGMTLQETADHLGVVVSVVHDEKKRIAALLKTELELSVNRTPAEAGKPELPAPFAPSRRQPPAAAPGATAPLLPPLIPQAPSADAKASAGVTPEIAMTRVQSPLGAEIYSALKNGAQALPTGGAYAGTVMTVKVPRAQLSGSAVDGILMLPVPLILQSDIAGEQEMIVSAAREVGEGDPNSRTFALYAFCKDEHLETPGDSSRFSFKAEVSDPKVTEIVTRSDLRQPETISQRLWDHYAAR